MLLARLGNLCRFASLSKTAAAVNALPSLANAGTLRYPILKKTAYYASLQMEAGEIDTISLKRPLSEDDNAKADENKRQRFSEESLKRRENPDPITVEAELEPPGKPALEGSKNETIPTEESTEQGEEELEGSDEGDPSCFAEMMKHGLTELDVGITKFVSSHKGFSGILKERYSDFVVHEIGKDGHVVHLDDFSVPVVDEDPPEEIFAVLSAEEKQQLEDLQLFKNKEGSVAIEIANARFRAEVVH
ncbi:UNVERIFIED_CONTAM: hypothetical protein K2H54_020720 [Gekko kuhli]